MTEPERPPLGLATLLALGVNGIVGVGIFVAPPIVAAAFPGPRGALVYLVVAFASFPIALVYARLARAFPIDGGPALYADRAFGPRVAHAIGVLVWVSSVVSNAAVTRALGELFAAWLGRPFLAPFFGVALVVVLAIVNARGLRLSALAWSILTVAKLAPLVVVAALGAFHRGISPVSAIASGARGSALLAISFALQGFEVVPLPAGQVRAPEKTVPRATIASLFGAGALYAAIHFACVRALPSLASSADAIPDAARALGGDRMARAVAAGVAASIAGIVVGTHAMTPRYLTAVVGGASSIDRRAIAISAVAVAPLVAFGSLGRLVDLSSAAVLAQYAAASAALLSLAARRREGLGRRDLASAALAILVVVVLLAQARPSELALAGGIALAGALVVGRLKKKPRP